MLLEIGDMLSGNCLMNRRIIGIFKWCFPFCSPYVREELTTVDKMSTVVIGYYGYSQAWLKHNRR